MGSGLCAIYELKSSFGVLSVSETKNNYRSAEKDNRGENYFQRMLSREPEEGATYSRNMVDTALHYEMDEKGLFGKPGSGRNVRVIESDDPMGTAMDFFSKISEGAKTDIMNGGSALFCNLNDGVRINFRPYSSTPGSPAVDIHMEMPDRWQKIHFIMRELL